MDLRYFEPASMVAISAAMVDEKLDRPLLMSIPLIAPLVDEMAGAHANLVNMQMTVSDQASALKNLTSRALGLDLDHDSLFRGSYNILTGIADIQSDPDKRAFLLELRDTLYPSGLSGVLDAYLVEAGNMELMAARITPEFRAYMQSVIIEDVSLMDTIERLIEIGKELGAVERERARLGSAEDTNAITKADLLAARRRWIRIMQAMIQLLDIAPDVSEDIRDRILQPLLKEEERMAKKRASDTPLNNAVDAAIADMSASATSTDAEEPTGTES